VTDWREVRPGYWRRDLPSGDWLGVKPDGSRWMWVLMVEAPSPRRRRGSRGPDVEAAFCFGFADAEAARGHADEHGPLPSRGL
jgi:hypothetical protein